MPNFSDPFYPGEKAADGSGPTDPRPLANLAENNRGMSVVVPLSIASTPQDGTYPYTSDGNGGYVLGWYPKYNDTPTGTQTLDIVSTPKDPGEEACTICVTLGIQYTPDPTAVPDIPFIVYALINWGIGGAAFSAMIDWDQGKQLSINASYINVKAVLVFPDVMSMSAEQTDISQPPYQPISYPTPAGTDVALSAAFSYGSPSHIGAAKLTLGAMPMIGLKNVSDTDKSFPQLRAQSYNISGTATAADNTHLTYVPQATQKVPTFASTVLLLGATPVEAANLGITFWDRDPNAVGQDGNPVNAQVVTTYTGPGPWTIPNGGNYFQLFNGNGGTATPRAIFAMTI